MLGMSLWKRACMVEVLRVQLSDVGIMTDANAMVKGGNHCNITTKLPNVEHVHTTCAQGMMYATCKMQETTSVAVHDTLSHTYNMAIFEGGYCYVEIAISRTEITLTRYPSSL